MSLSRGLSGAFAQWACSPHSISPNTVSRCHSAPLSYSLSQIFTSYSFGLSGHEASCSEHGPKSTLDFAPRDWLLPPPQSLPTSVLSYYISVHPATRANTCDRHDTTSFFPPPSKHLLDTGTLCHRSWITAVAPSLVPLPPSCAPYRPFLK